MKKLKRVSFKVAKAIKEAGYPQDRNNRTILYPTKGEFKGVLCSYNDAAPERDKDSINAPTYIEVQLWLWREKHIPVWVDYVYHENKWYAIYDGEPLDACVDAGDYAEGKNDPEEAIIAAIEYLVDNNLIK